MNMNWPNGGQFIRSGFFAMEDPARTDYSMLMGLIFLAAVGAGRWSLDWIFWSKPPKRCEEGPPPRGG